MNQPFSWDSISAFLAVIRTGSLSAAARRLKVAQPTVRGHIEALERALDRALFVRSHSGLQPTEAALQAVPYAETMAANAEALARAVSGVDRSAAQGVVRLTCSEIIGLEVLPAILAALRRTHPGIQLELVPTDRNEDLLRRDADIAIRMVRPTQQALVARHIGDVELGLFATQSYLQKHGVPQDLADLLSGHALIGYDRLDGLIQVMRAAGLELSRRNFAIRTDSGPTQFAAIRAGLGIGIYQVPLAQSGRVPLQRVIPEFHYPLPVWIVMHEDLRPVRRVRLVFDFLAQAMADYQGGMSELP